MKNYDLTPYSIAGWHTYTEDFLNGNVQVWVCDDEDRMLYCLITEVDSPKHKALLHMLEEDRVKDKATMIDVVIGTLLFAGCIATTFFV